MLFFCREQLLVIKNHKIIYIDLVLCIIRIASRGLNCALSQTMNIVIQVVCLQSCFKKKSSVRVTQCEKQLN